MSDLIQLQKINPAEPLPFQESCGLRNEDYLKIITTIVQHFAVDLGSFSDSKQFIFSNTAPGPEHRNKVWVKTELPYAVGYFIDGQYQMDYGMMGVPVEVPFLHDPKISELNIPGLILIPDSDLVKYGITNTTTGAAERMRWYLFSPTPITV